MTPNEWIPQAAVLRTIYRSDNFLSDEPSVHAWYDLLKDLPAEAVKHAIQMYMLQEKYPPHPSDIRRLVADTGTKIEDWSEGWARVLSAVRKYGYYQEEKALESLPDETRKAVERIGWKQLCMSSSEEQTAMRANFRMIYNTLEERKKDQLRLPEQFRPQIEYKKPEVLQIAMQAAERIRCEKMEGRPNNGPAEQQIRRLKEEWYGSDEKW